MTADQYRSEMLPEIYKRYSYKDGEICVGKTRDGVAPIWICVPTVDNPSSPWNPTTCYVWNRETLLYKGDLSKAAVISRLCNKFKICNFVYTTVSKMETSHEGIRKCVCTEDEMNNCKRKCPFKQDRLASVSAKVFG